MESHVILIMNTLCKYEDRKMKVLLHVMHIYSWTLKTLHHNIEFSLETVGGIETTSVNLLLGMLNVNA